MQEYCAVFVYWLGELVVQVEIVRTSCVESQLRMLGDEIGIVFPSLTAGRRQFFSDLLSQPSDVSRNKATGSVLPEPHFGLVFPTAGEVLSSVMRDNDPAAGRQDRIGNLLLEFGLPPTKATQPVYSLSGGEQLLLTFAKLKASGDALEKIVACSPLHSLDPNRHVYWEKLSHFFTSQGKAIKVILLDGEAFPGVVEESVLEGSQVQKPVQWRLTIQGLLIRFPEVQFPTHHPAFELKYLSEEVDHVLCSPTLVTGDNGVGKSAFAKALAGVLRTDRGTLRIAAPNGTGSGRLLFQEADEQLFGKSISEHLHWAFRYDQEKGKLAQSIYNEIEGSLRDFVNKDLSYADSLGSADNPTTELQTKIGLAAERIASKPSLLILDEPSRKLCKPISQRLILAICDQAHKQNIPVLIISHLPEWWRQFTQSHIMLSRDGDARTKVTFNADRC
jgi:energy-coupling factor transporter ATP-binding protein EcfA2